MSAPTRVSRSLDRRRLLLAGAGTLASAWVPVARADDPPAAGSIRLVLLGTKGGPTMRTDGQFPASNLLMIDGVPWIVDTGYGVTARLLQAKVPLASIRYVFITHHHSDHNLEYGVLLDNAWAAGLKETVRTFGPKGLVALDAATWEANRFDIDTRIADEGRPDLRRLIVPTDIEPGLVLDTGRVKVTAMRNRHPPIVDSYAYRFEVGGRSIVFSGDTAYFPPLAEFAKGADLLLHEVMSREGVDRLLKRFPGNAATLREHLEASHTLAEDVGRIAEQAGVKTLVLTHFVPNDDPLLQDRDWTEPVRRHYRGNLIVGHDLLEIPIA